MARTFYVRGDDDDARFVLDQVKPNTIKLIFVASPLSKQL